MVAKWEKGIRGKRMIREGREKGRERESDALAHFQGQV